MSGKCTKRGCGDGKRHPNSAMVLVFMGLTLLLTAFCVGIFSPETSHSDQNGIYAALNATGVFLVTLGVIAEGVRRCLDRFKDSHEK